MRCVALSLFAASVNADVKADLVSSLPGFPSPIPFKVYSGYLTVKGPFEQNPYDELKIHYQFHTSQRSPEKDPVATWHQGGPGGSSMYGAYTEMGYFQFNMQGNKTDAYDNKFAWNRVANMLYLESPAGSGQDSGFSQCVHGGKAVGCKWNDTSQAEAYAKTLRVFYEGFPEFKANDLFFTGESYAGQYVPNIAHYILTNMPGVFNLKGIALGNACTHPLLDDNTLCQGDHTRFEAQLLYGNGFVSKKSWTSVANACGYGRGEASCTAADSKTKCPKSCSTALNTLMRSAGQYNIYNIYDNCGDDSSNADNLGALPWRPARQGELEGAPGGGYDWSCGGADAYQAYFMRSDVQSAMHLEKPGQSGFNYNSSGPGSITLYPELAKKLRVLIFNGEADACVPYIGNEEWTSSLAAQGVLKENKAWHTWFVEGAKSVPAGYATTYTTVGTQNDFSFVTIRLAGHMVPTFQPAAAFEMVTRFFAGTAF